MSGKRLWIAVLTVVTMLAASAVAQDEKNELGGTSAARSSATRESRTRTFPNPIIAFGQGAELRGRVCAAGSS